MTDPIFNGMDTAVMINGYSLLILCIFFFTRHPKNHGVRTRQFMFFQHIVIINIVLLITDTISFLVVGNTAPGMRTTQVVATTIYYILDPLPSYFFMLFVDIGLNTPIEKQLALRKWYAIPVVLHTLIAVVTPFTGWFFQIDALNLYHRGPLLPVSFFLSFILMIIAAVKVLRRYAQSRKLNRGAVKDAIQYGALLKFTVLPFTGRHFTDF